MRRSVALLLVLCACQGPVRPQPVEAGAGADAIVRTTQQGPVKATVSLSPQAPRLGDPLVLVLSIEAEPQVSVDMPPFGEALGRFAIVGFTPRSSTDTDGRTRASQRYLLDAPMSGRQRIPSLRVEFTDRRSGDTRPSAAGSGEREGELLTDEIPVDIASVLPEGQVQDQLRGLRGPLQEQFYRSRGFRYGAVVVALLLGAGLAFGLHALRRRARQRVRASAYDVAMGRLQRLLDRGLPAPEAADAFYVELSHIVRHYVEDRYGVRAPELTTEEFLREARRLAAMQQAHRELLSAFLEVCDRVKFAAYRPVPEESRQALVQARRFLTETRLPEPGEGQP